MINKKEKKRKNDLRAKDQVNKDIIKKEKDEDPIEEEVKININIFLENKRKRCKNIEEKKYQLKISRLEDELKGKLQKIDEDIDLEYDEIMAEYYERVEKKILWERLSEEIKGNKKK